jgi:hypothetical protein
MYECNFATRKFANKKKKKKDNRIVNKTNDHLVSGSCKINWIMLASCVNNFMFNHHEPLIMQPIS